MLIQELLGLYLDHHLNGRPSEAYYRRLVRQVFGPIAAVDLAAVDKLLILRWWSSLADRPGHANKSLGLLRAAFNWALSMDLVTGLDPTAGIAKRPEDTRATIISPSEWVQAVPHLENLKLRRRVYFWTLYLSGSRPCEVRLLKPEYMRLDDEIPCWIIPTSKNKRPHVKPIPHELVPLLRMVIQTNPPEAVYVFWGSRPDRPWSRTSAQKMWEGIRAKAGLDHLWMNDLRRSTASDLLNQGESLGVVQGALNHRSLSQTAKYAYLAVKPLSVALQKRADRIVGCL